MIMIKRLLFILIFNIAFCAIAQNVSEKLFAVKQKNNNIGIGTIRLTEPYLSPFEYQGNFIHFSQEQISLFNPTNKKLSYNLGSDFKIGKARHPNKNNGLFLYEINGFAGFNRHFTIQNNLSLLIGSDIDLTVGGKYMGRNVNNPFSLDLNSNINATAKLFYKFSLLDVPFRLSYNVKTSLLGVMFVPLKGLSYYEMYSLNSWQDAFHFSSLHNRQMIKQGVNIDILFNCATFRLGVKHQTLKYSANDMVFKNNQVAFSIGTVFYFYKFRGNKVKNTDNFIPAL